MSLRLWNSVCMMGYVSETSDVRSARRTPRLGVYSVGWREPGDWAADNAQRILSCRGSGCLDIEGKGTGTGNRKRGSRTWLTDKR